MVPSDASRGCVAFDERPSGFRDGSGVVRRANILAATHAPSMSIRSWVASPSESRS